MITLAIITVIIGINWYVSNSLGVSMKSVLNKIEKEKPKKIQFPVLAEALVGGETFIVLFLSDTKGVVVKGNLCNTVGELVSNYVSVTDETHWRILSPEESIVLSND